MIEFYEYEVYILCNQEWLTRTLKEAILEHERGNSALLLELQICHTKKY